MTYFYVALIIFVLFAFIVFLIKPNKKRDLSCFFGGFYAHRGLHDMKDGVNIINTQENIIPENSKAAFSASKKAGYGVELDVRLTKDEKLVVFHDDNLLRLCGKDSLVVDNNYSELEVLNLLGSGEKMPLFSEVLQLLGKTRIICEIKASKGQLIDTLCRKTAEHIDTYEGDICIESFNPFVLAWFRKNRPDIIRGQLSMDFRKSNVGLNIFESFIMRNLLLNVIAKPDFISYKHNNTNVFGFKLCKTLFKPYLAGWTICSKSEEKDALKIFDMIIFESYLPKKDKN